jgi:hypothetical protein
VALFAAEDACEADFREPTYKGLGWIGGANELQQDLEDESANPIWRCICHRNRHLTSNASLS